MHGDNTKAAELAAKLAEFNRYFTSSNGVDVGERVSVPRDEWRSLYALLRASEGRVPVAELRWMDPKGSSWCVVVTDHQALAGLPHKSPLFLAAPHPPAQQAGPDGVEGWEGLAWELCADEHGEESCGELIWEGGPIPEPWGERWLKYEEEAKRLIALVHKHVPAHAQQAEPIPAAELEREAWLSHGYGAGTPQAFMFLHGARYAEKRASPPPHKAEGAEHVDR